MRGAPLPADFYDDTENRINPRHVVAEIGRKYNLKPEQIRGSWQYPDLMAARREIAARLREEGFSYPKIGNALARHHTTIIGMLKSEGHHQSRRRNWGKVTPPPDRTQYFQDLYEARKAAKRATALH